MNLGGSVTSIQPLRINLTSNENFTDKDWQITGIPRTLHIENSTNRTNNARERNIELVGNLLPGITLVRYVLDVKNNYLKFVLNHIHQQLQRQLSN